MQGTQEPQPQSYGITWQQIHDLRQLSSAPDFRSPYTYFGGFASLVLLLVLSPPHVRDFAIKRWPLLFLGLVPGIAVGMVATWIHHRTAKASLLAKIDQSALAAYNAAHERWRVSSARERSNGESRARP